MEDVRPILQSEDSSIEGEVSDVEGQLINFFNSRFGEFAKNVLESPPTSIEEIDKIGTACLIMSQLCTEINNSSEKFNKLKEGKLI